MKHARFLLPLLLAIGWTGLNALKPPVIDDTAYLAVARQMAKAPLDPYGFEQFWYEAPQPANQVLAPPVLPYWLSLGIRLFGEDISLLKLWLFPFVVLFVFALRALLRKFAPRLKTPLLILAVCGPAILPALNFMLDIPAMALCMAALVTLIRAAQCERSARWLLAISAGLLAGLAAQTKYSGLLAAPLLLGYALIHRRLAPGALAVVVGTVAFVLWEVFMARQYGDSHFVYALRDSNQDLVGKLKMLGPLPTLLGGVGAALLVLAAAALGIPRRWLGVLVVVVFVGYAALALQPDTMESAWGGPGQASGWKIVRPFFFGIGCAVLVGTLAVIGLRLIRFRGRILARSRTAWFLVFWFALEFAGYVAMTPFPATRRVIGLTLVATLLLGRLLSLHPARRAPAWLAAGVSAILGFAYASVDILDAMNEPRLVREADRHIRGKNPAPTIWFAGHWGFQYEAERRGMKPVVPGRSELKAGDWLVVPGNPIHKQGFGLSAPMGPGEFRLHIPKSVPVRTLPTYYGGALPLEPWAGPRLEVIVYRIQADCVLMP